jgi:TolB-like protein/DNA-binding winged helix-turn-helix (wHTH) protein/tetratricopeptide (TPR) repeat protein
MSLKPNTLEFQGFVVDLDEKVLSKGGKPVSLPPKALDLLLTLVRQPGHIFEKEELLETVWPNTFVEEGNLTYTVRQLRKALNDDAGSPRFIETIPRRGYRFVAEIAREVKTDNAERGPMLISRSRGSNVEGFPRLATSPATAHARARQSEQTADAFEDSVVRKFPVAVSDLSPTDEPDKGQRSWSQILAFFALIILTVGVAVGGYFYFRNNTSSGDRRSIVVLPLANESGNGDLEYLSDGISESLINSLSDLERLRVIARSTAFRYKQDLTDPGEIGKKLGVDTVLTGRVAQLGENLVVQVDLIDVADGSQIWGERYTRKYADLLEVQQAISREIVSRLQPKLDVKQVASLGTENPKAYQLYLKANFFRHRRIESELQRSVTYAQEALSEDPNYALAYVAMADSYNVMGFYAFLSPDRAFPKAREAATKALELNKDLSEAYNSLAYVSMYYDWDLPRAEREFLRAIELKPNYSVAHQWYGNLLTATGRWDDAIREFQIARELDPVSPVITAVPGWTYFYARQYEGALEPCEKALELEPTFPLGHIWLGQAYERLGEYDKAIQSFQQAKEHSKGAPEAVALLAHVYAVAGNREGAQQTLEELIDLSSQRYVSPYHVATVYAGLGEHDLAFEWLNKALKDRQNVMVFLPYDPRLDALRSDKRFQDLVRKISPSTD